MHAPFTQAWLVQAPALCHVPVALQVCGCWPLHCTCPGPHTPWHDPDTQVVFVQAEPVFPHAPDEVQVCGCWPLHWVLVGEHDPLHTPLMQA